MADLVIDTDVVSFAFRQDSRFINHYGPAIEGHRLIISFMTLGELQFGVLNRGWGKQQRDKLTAHLQEHYVHYGVSREICDLWADLIWESKQQGRVMQTADAWIAATAIALDVPLVTHNAKDYQHLSRLDLVTFPSQ